MHGAWEPRVGERVAVVATSKMGTITRVGPDGDHLVCEVRYDSVPGIDPERMVWSHAPTELVPIGETGERINR